MYGGESDETTGENKFLEGVDAELEVELYKGQDENVKVW